MEYLSTSFSNRNAYSQKRSVARSSVRCRFVEYFGFHASLFAAACYLLHAKVEAAGMIFVKLQPTTDLRCVMARGAVRVGA